MDQNLKKLDELAEKFEKNWAEVHSIEDAVRFVKSHPSKIDEAVVACEIFSIDVERRWQHWDTSINVELDVASLEEMKKVIPSSDDYIRLANKHQIFLNEQLLADLQTHEFKSRVQYGDCPQPSELVDSKVKRKMAAEQPVVKLFEGGNTEFLDGFWGGILAGRQADGDSPPYSWSTEGQIKKLVCSEGANPMVSRNQLEILVVNQRYVLLKNNSSNRHLNKIGRTGRLAPQEAKLFELPVRIRLDSVVLEISRNENIV